MFVINSLERWIQIFLICNPFLLRKQKIHYLLQCIEINPTVKFAIYCSKILKIYKSSAKEWEFNQCIFKEKPTITVTTRLGRDISHPIRGDYVYY